MLPLAFVPSKGAVIKANSYEHDESGITTEDPGITKAMQDKRLAKEAYLSQELEGYETVKIYGDTDSPTALLSWGSNKGVVKEVAEKAGLRAVHLQVLWPFPIKSFQKALSGVKDLVCVENNATGQLIRLIRNFGYKVDKKILNYDGGPFSVDVLEQELQTT
jgi:2-oxoglutarate ferredoxin oxidoreductase subunit alpha